MVRPSVHEQVRTGTQTKILGMPVPGEQGRHKRSLLREQAYLSLRDAIVNGTLRFEREVELQVGAGAVIGPLEGVAPKRVPL